MVVKFPTLSRSPQQADVSLSCRRQKHSSFIFLHCLCVTVVQCVCHNTALQWRGTMEKLLLWCQNQIDKLASSKWNKTTMFLNYPLLHWMHERMAVNEIFGKWFCCSFVFLLRFRGLVVVWSLCDGQTTNAAWRFQKCNQKQKHNLDLPNDTTAERRFEQGSKRQPSGYWRPALPPEPLLPQSSASDQVKEYRRNLCFSFSRWHDLTSLVAFPWWPPSSLTYSPCLMMTLCHTCTGTAVMLWILVIVYTEINILMVLLLACIRSGRIPRPTIWEEMEAEPEHATGINEKTVFFFPET